MAIAAPLPSRRQTLPRLHLYGTHACHLCEEAETLLLQALNGVPGRFELKTIDIIDVPELSEHYAIRIPVVRDPDSNSELGWPFDLQDLVGFIGKL